MILDDHSVSHPVPLHLQNEINCVSAPYNML